jgi:hypothetical protein
MKKDCNKIVQLGIGIADCCEEKKKKKCKPRRRDCLVLPVYNFDPESLLPNGGEPGDHLVKDEDNKPVWKPANECDCEPVEGIPEGGKPGEVVSKDDDNNTVWKSIAECACDPDDLLPAGGEPDDVLTKDQDNKPVWKPVTRCECEPDDLLPPGGQPGDHLVKDENNNTVWKPEKTQPTTAQVFYVRKDGDDDNTGFADNSAEAFRTINGAFNKIQERQFTSPYNITIYIGEGVFNESVRCAALSLTSSVLILQGSGRDKTAIEAPRNTGAFMAVSGLVHISGVSFSVTVDNGTSPSAIYAQRGSNLVINGDVRAQMTATNTNGSIMVGAGGRVSLLGSIIFTGNPSLLWYAHSDGTLLVGSFSDNSVIDLRDLTADVAGYSIDRSLIERGPKTSIVTNNATIARRFYVSRHSSILANGAGLEWLPGSSAGTVDSASFGYYGN